MAGRGRRGDVGGGVARHLPVAGGVRRRRRPADVPLPGVRWSVAGDRVVASGAGRARDHACRLRRRRCRHAADRRAGRGAGAPGRSAADRRRRRASECVRWRAARRRRAHDAGRARLRGPPPHPLRGGSGSGRGRAGYAAHRGWREGAQRTRPVGSRPAHCLFCGPSTQGALPCSASISARMSAACSFISSKPLIRPA